MLGTDMETLLRIICVYRFATDPLCEHLLDYGYHSDHGSCAARLAVEKKNRDGGTGRRGSLERCAGLHASKKTAGDLMNVEAWSKDLWVTLMNSKFI